MLQVPWGHGYNMPGRMDRVSHNTVSNMLHTPSTHNMPQTCMTWTQNMCENAKVKKQNGAKGRVKKFFCSKLVLTTLTTMGKYHFGGSPMH